MSAKNQKNSIKTLISLMGVASASIFATIPALALINSNSNSFNSSVNNRTLSAESTARSGQLLAQGTSGTGGTGTGQTGTGTGTNQTGAGQTGTGTGTNQTGAGQTGTGTGTNQTGAGQTGTGTGTNQTGAGQTGTGTGTNQTGAGQTGTGTGTNQTGAGQTGTGTGTNQTNTGGTTSGNGQTNSPQDAFRQYMLAGYAATQQRDYPTALAYFQRALQMRPNNPYARRAVSNVQGYMQRNGQRGTSTTTPTNQGGASTTPTNQGGATSTPTNQPNR